MENPPVYRYVGEQRNLLFTFSLDEMIGKMKGTSFEGDFVYDYFIGPNVLLYFSRRLTVVEEAELDNIATYCNLKKRVMEWPCLTCGKIYEEGSSCCQ